MEQKASADGLFNASVNVIYSILGGVGMQNYGCASSEPNFGGVEGK